MYRIISLCFILHLCESIFIIIGLNLKVRNGCCNRMPPKRYARDPPNVDMTQMFTGLTALIQQHADQ